MRATCDAAPQPLPFQPSYKTIQIPIITSLSLSSLDKPEIKVSHEVKSEKDQDEC
jgi:hypothetical protein